MKIEISDLYFLRGWYQATKYNIREQHLSNEREKLELKVCEYTLNLINKLIEDLK